MITEEERSGLVDPPVRRRRLKWAKRILFGLLIAVGIVYAAGFFVIAPIARRQLEKLSSGTAFVKSARLTGIGELQINGVILADKNQSPADNPVLQADTVKVGFYPSRLLLGQFKIHSIVLSDFLLQADYDPQTKKWNLEQLQFKSDSKDNGGFSLIRIENGTIRIRHKQADQYQVVTTVGFDGQISTASKTHEYNFKLTADELFDLGGSEFEGVLDLDTEKQRNRLGITGKMLMSDARIFDNSWDIKRIRLDCEFDENEIILDQFGFDLGQAMLDIQGQIHRTPSGPEMDLSLKLEKLRLADQYTKNAVVYSEPLLSHLDPGFRAFLERYNPVGSLDFQLDIKGSIEDLSKADIAGLIKCRNVSILDEKFPYQLHEVVGDIELLGRNLHIKQLRGRHGEVDVEINGTVENMGPNAIVDLRTTSPNMRFDQDLYAALNESIKKVWFAFTPSGIAGIDYHFQRLPDGQKQKYLELTLKDAGAVYQHFPYPLEHVSGTVIVAPTEIQLNGLVANYEDGRKVSLNGRVFKLEQQEPSFRIQVDAKQIPVDNRLIGAMPKQQRVFLDDLEIDAVADLDVDIFSSQTKNRLIDYIAKIDLRGKKLVNQDFPLPLENFHLVTDITHDYVKLHQLNAVAAGSDISLKGQLWPKGDQPETPGFCLDFDIQDFDLNPAFWDALGSNAEKRLGLLRADGEIDVKGHLAVNVDSPGCQPTDLQITFNQNALSWTGQPLGQVNGTLHLKEEIAEFQDFSMSEINPEMIPLEMLSEKLQMFLEAADPKGILDVAVHQGYLRLGQEGLESLDVDFAVDIRDFMYGSKQLVRNVDGRLSGDVQIDRKNKTGQMLMDYHLDQLYYRNWRVSDIRGKLEYKPDQMTLESSDFSAQLAGGQLGGSYRIELKDPNEMQYSFDTVFSDISVREFLMAGHDPEGNEVQTGLANGEFNLTVPISKLKEPHGNIKIKVRDMKLGKQSLLGAILTTIQFRQPNDFMFTELEFDALVNGPELDCQRVRIVGKPLLFYGSGLLNIDSHQIKMELVSLDRIIGKEDDILNMLARGVGSALWKIKISGDVKDPKVEAVYLSVLKQPLDLFKKKKE